MTQRRPFGHLRWIAFLATVLIVASFPLARWQEARLRGAAASQKSLPVTYVGRAKCIECHQGQWDKFRGSDHDRAMDVATPETVLADFNNAVFDMDGVTTRFFRRDGKFFVNTEGPDGKMADFEVRYVFGVRPLQQYLVPLPGGRYQVLGIAWDTERHRWYDMYPEQDIAPEDWLHWSRQGQNWNSMCAECHSTHLVKGYDMTSDAYTTTFSEIDVSCEACHGPGSQHVAWAETPAMGRPESENFELPVKTRDLTAKQEVALCAPCHSRRYLLGPLDPKNDDLLDREVPTLLTEDLYHPDGQILGEDFEYGSFVQSKMYRMGVKCSNCHDPHSLKRHKDRNDLCLQCHQAKAYNSSEHHFHKQFDQGEPSDGWLCVKCHMPERAYMVVDWRADHYIRSPRPDLSRSLETPNACNQIGCHGDKSVDWSIAAMEKWYGKRKRPNYGETFAKGRRQDPEARTELGEVAHDSAYAGIVRATAIDLLSGYRDAATIDSLNRALSDEDALVRLTAIRALNDMNYPGLTKVVAPLLYDPVAAVRIEAAANLADGSRSDQLRPAERKVYEQNLKRYREVMTYSGDFAFGRYNLGNLEANLGHPDAAIDNYKAALKIDSLFYPAKFNLAMIENRLNKKKEAETLLREVVETAPNFYTAAYSLGLLLVETKNLEAAAYYLKKAANGMPGHARVQYNFGLLLQRLGQSEKAGAYLKAAVNIEPVNRDFLYAFAEHSFKRGQLVQAEKTVHKLLAAFPEDKRGQTLLSAVIRARNSADRK